MESDLASFDHRYAFGNIVSGDIGPARLPSGEYSGTFSRSGGYTEVSDCSDLAGDLNVDAAEGG